VPSFNKSNKTLKPKAPFAVLKPYIAVLASLSVVLEILAAAHVTSRRIPISLLLFALIVVGAFLGAFGLGLFARIVWLVQRVIASDEPILKKEISAMMPKGSRKERELQVSFFPIKRERQLCVRHQCPC
jgi:hypothetical protein